MSMDQQQAPLNRQQRRAQKKALKGRIRKMDQSQYHAYQARARMWSKGQKLLGRHIDGELDAEWQFSKFMTPGRKKAVADYATHAPMRWKITAYCVGKADDGSLYISDSEAVCGQMATPVELYDLRCELMREARKDVNPRHAWDEYFVMECLG